LSNKGEFSFLSFKSDFQVGYYQTGEGANQKVCHSLAAVIDGSVVHCTPLSKYCPPPPMSHFQIKFTGQVVDLFFGRNSIGAIVLEGKTYKAQSFSYDWEQGSVTGQVCNLSLEQSINCPRFSSLIQEFEKPDTLYFVSGSNNNTAILSYGASGDHQSVSQQVFESGVSLLWVAGHKGASESNQKMAYFFFDGSVESYPTSGFQLELPAEGQNIVKIVDFKDKDGQLHFACLTESSHLYIDRELIADSCTSFCCADGFFLFTVMTQGMFDMLFLYPIKDLVKARTAVGFLHLRLPDRSRILLEKTII
jgi:hypothetical protein